MAEDAVDSSLIPAVVMFNRKDCGFYFTRDTFKLDA
jgi:hypothetical protein